MPHVYEPYTAAAFKDTIDAAFAIAPAAPVYILVPPATADPTLLGEVDKQCQAANARLGRECYFAVSIPQGTGAKQQLFSRHILPVLKNTPSSIIIGPDVDGDLSGITTLFGEKKEGSESLKQFIQTIKRTIEGVDGRPTKKKKSSFASGAPLGGNTPFQRKYLAGLDEAAKQLTNNKRNALIQITPKRFEIQVKHPKDENGRNRSYLLIVTPEEVTVTKNSDLAYEGFALALSKMNPKPGELFNVVLYHPDPNELEKMVAACEAKGMKVFQGGFTDHEKYKAHRKGFNVDLDESGRSTFLHEETTLTHTRRTSISV